jgi:hypothetical protein
MLADKRYCYPLTVTDHASRYLLLCEAMESNAERPAFTTFERLFKERGLPRAIRSDNGVPFASPNGLFNLSKFPCGGCGWASASNALARAIPGRTGRHERMHLTLKQEATRPAANILQQQAKFDTFLDEFNRQGSGRRHLARQLYGLRLGLYRSGGKNAAAPRQPLWPKSVAYVLGNNLSGPDTDSVGCGGRI